MKITATGHRPPRLGLGYGDADRRTLAGFATCVLAEMRDRGYRIEEAISGMAQGWDQAFASAALSLGIPLVAALPFDGQDQKWPEDARAIYRDMLGRATLVEVVCPGDHANWKFIRRDEWMADRADVVVALWDGEKQGGTWKTVRHATHGGKNVLNVMPLWERWRQEKLPPLDGADQRAIFATAFGTPLTEDEKREWEAITRSK